MMGWNALVLWAATATAPMAPLPTPEQIMQLPPELKAELHERVTARNNNPTQRLERLVEYVFDADGLGLSYEFDATHTVAEAWQTRKINCLSFTLLFVAMAREVGVDASVQEVVGINSWFEAEGTLYSAGHVNARASTHSGAITLDLARDMLYSRRGPQVISDSRAVAHFYNNRGAELMAAGQFDNARRYFHAALEIAPDFVSGWNNLGVLSVRAGELDAAQRHYDHALALDAGHAPTLSNALVLAQRLGHGEQARAYESRLQRARKRDPFYLYQQGAAAERSGDYVRAVRLYKRALRLYGEAHQFYFGLARAYYLDGQNTAAERALLKAREVGTASDRQRALYDAKLDALRRRSEPRTAMRH